MYLFCILFFIYSCYNAEEVILLSQNGTVFASKGQNVDLTCKTSMNNLITVRYKKPNVAIQNSPYLKVKNCYPPENFTCDHSKKEFTYSLQQSDYNNGDTWSCIVTNSSQVPYYSSFIIITIIESISSTTMTLPTGNTAVINVNASRLFACETSLSRPKAEILWYKTLMNGTEVQFRDGSSLDVMTNASMTWSKSQFNYTAKESDNGVRIKCLGRLPLVPTDTPKESKEVVLTIRYPPAGQPTTNNDGSVRVKAEFNITILCYISGGNPHANLSWNCNGHVIQGINRPNGTTFQSELVLRATSTLNGKTCVCIATHQLMNERTVSTDLNILFPAEQKINLSSSHVGYINASSTVTLKCVVNGGNPVANLTWDCNDINTRAVNTYSADKAISTITFKVEKENNGKTCTCTADHYLWDDKIQEHSTLNVSFAPDTNLEITGATNETAYYANDTVVLSCSISNGNPLAKLTFICWDTIYGIDENNSTTTVSVISSIAMPSGNSKMCKCTAEHILLQPIVETFIQTTIYYPPTKPSLSFNPSQPLLEGQDVYILCNASEGNPHITSYTWTRNGELLATTNNTLKVINIDKDTNNQSLKCRVRNKFTEYKEQVIESNTDHFDVYYHPLIFEINKTLTTSEGMIINQSCVAMGNPIPNVQWFRGIHNMSTENSGKSNLKLLDINRDQQGDYYCKATAVATPYGQLESQFNVTIVVNYPPDVSILVEGNNMSVDSSIKLFCNATGQPDNYDFTGWDHSFHSKEIRNKNEMQIHVNGNYLLLPKLSYQDIGNYSCFVDNGIKNRNGLLTQTNSIEIAVNGFPIKIPTTPIYPIFTTEQRSTLIAKLLFYTFPNITGFQWYNLTTGAAISLPVANTNITKTTLKYELYGQQVDFSNFAYEALFTIENFQHYHEGSYSLIVSNMERMSNFTFRAQISGPPDSPLFVNVSEKTDSAITLLLFSGFDGGHDQIFHVVYHVMNNEDGLYDQRFADQRTELQFLKISNLIPSTTYKLSVFASNEKGNSTLNETLCCKILIVQTDDKTEVEPSQQKIQLEGLAAGLAVAVFTVIFIIVLVVFLKRRIPLFSKGKEDNGRLTLTADAKNDEAGEDVLKDNILYESAGSGFVRNDCSNSTEYAMVQKKGDRFITNENEDNLQETGLYSVVSKTPKTPADVSVNAFGDKKGKDRFKNKKNKNHSAIEDVYENMSDETGMKSKNNSIKTNRNRDGLQYAELVFNPLSNGSKFVIHGLEDRTVYAIVDTTQKIDPLPDSDDEEDKQSPSSDKQD